MSAHQITLHVGDIRLSEHDRAYIVGAMDERHQSWEDFVREALLAWAAY